MNNPLLILALIASLKQEVVLLQQELALQMSSVAVQQSAPTSTNNFLNEDGMTTWIPQNQNNTRSPVIATPTFVAPTLSYITYEGKQYIDNGSDEEIINKLKQDEFYYQAMIYDENIHQQIPFSSPESILQDEENLQSELMPAMDNQ